MTDAEEMLASALKRPLSRPAPAHALLRDEVYARLSSWIVDGLLPPGMTLRDKDIADALNVSRTPVREAIRRLQDEGLVLAEASRWTKVAPLDIAIADRIYPLVWTLEPLALRQHQGFSWADVARLRAANGEIAAAVEAQDAMSASEGDTAFHRLLTDPERNPELALILESLKVRLRRLEVAYFVGTATGESSVAEHDRVIAAIEDGQLDAAADELAKNWRASLKRLQQRVDLSSGS